MQHLLSCPAYGNYQPPYERCTCGLEDIEQQPTLTKRILTLVKHRPGLPAWTIAKQLGADAATVSSTLYYQVGRKNATIRREQGDQSWLYYPKEM